MKNVIKTKHSSALFLFFLHISSFAAGGSHVSHLDSPCWCTKREKAVLLRSDYKRHPIMSVCVLKRPYKNCLTSCNTGKNQWCKVTFMNS